MLVRQAISRRIGIVHDVAVARSGFTPAFAAKVTTENGTWFVKAASADGPFGAAAVRESHILAHMPAGLPVSTLCWTEDVDGWIVLCLKAIDGHMPGHPWTPRDVTAVLGTQATLAHSLATPPQALAEAVADKEFSSFATQWLCNWQQVAGGRELAVPLPAWLSRHVAAMAELEQLLVEQTKGHTGVMHLDARPDNALVHDGNATIVDWNFAMLGPAYPDTIDMLQSMYGQPGIDVDRLAAEHETTRDVHPDLIDAVLAAIGGLLLTGSYGPHVESSPMLRTHQRAQAVRSLTWLAQRRGWTPKSQTSA